MSTNLFFVYGTLKAGRGNNRILGDSTLLGKSLTCNYYTLLNLGCPGAIIDANGKQILGEVYEVTSKEVVQSLDRLENNGNFYTRVLRPVELVESDEVLSAWIYELTSRDFGYLGYCPINKEFNAYEWK